AIFVGMPKIAAGQPLLRRDRGAEAAPTERSRRGGRSYEERSRRGGRSHRLEPYAHADPRGARRARAEEAGGFEVVAEHLVRLAERAERLVLRVEHVVGVDEQRRAAAQAILAAQVHDRVAVDRLEPVALVA